MRKILCVVALAVSSLYAGTAAASDLPAPQDQAFLRTLAQPAPAVVTEAAPAAAVQLSILRPAPVAPISIVYCGGIYCANDTTCWSHCPGGDGSSYCNRSTNKCVPY